MDDMDDIGTDEVRRQGMSELQKRRRLIVEVKGFKSDQQAHGHVAHALNQADDVVWTSIESTEGSEDRVRDAMSLDELRRVAALAENGIPVHEGDQIAIEGFALVQRFKAAVLDQEAP
jgi:hypothetical protein